MAERKSIQISILILILLFSILPALFSQEDRPILAILDFKSSGIPDDEMNIYMEMVSSYLVDTGKYRVIDRTQRDLMLEELQFSMSGISDQKAQIEVGKLLSAEYLVVGSVGVLSNKHILSIKILLTDTSETMKSFTESYKSFNKLIDDTKKVIFTLTDAGAVSSKKPGTGSSGSFEIGGWAVFRLETPRLYSGNSSSLVINESNGSIYSEEEFDALYKEQLTPAIGLSAGYTYGFSKWFGLGLYGGLFFSTFPAPEEFTFSDIDNSYHWYGSWEKYPLLIPYIGPKIIIGDVERIAVALMAAIGFQLDSNGPLDGPVLMPAIGIYFKNYHLNVNIISGANRNKWVNSNIEVFGVGFEFGYSFPAGDFFKDLFND